MKYYISGTLMPKDGHIKEFRKEIDPFCASALSKGDTIDLGDMACRVKLKILFLPQNELHVDIGDIASRFTDQSEAAINDAVIEMKAIGFEFYEGDKWLI